MYTLFDFIQHHPVKNLTLLTKEVDFSQIEVASISVQEIPADNFVRPNDMILSTAIGCLYKPNVFKKFLRDIKESGASVLLLTFKDPDYIMDSGVLSYADKIDLPVFSIPWEIHFSDVINFVSGQIYEKKIAIYQSVQDTLFHAYFNGDSLSDAAEIIAGFFQASILVRSKGGVQKAVWPLDFVPSDEDPFTFSISMNKYLWGYVHVYDSKEPALLEENAIIERCISTPLSLWFNKESIQDTTRLEIQNDFLWNLAQGNYTSLEDMSLQAKKMDFNLELPYFCVMFQVSQGNRPSQELIPTLLRLNSFLEEAILALKDNSKLSVMYASKELRFLLYIQGGEQGERFFRKLKESLEGEFPKLTFCWGVSEMPAEESIDFSTYYDHAHLALQYCLNNPSRNMLTYQDTKISKIISALSSQEEITDMAKDLVQCLKAGEKNSSIDLVGTLIEFIKCNGNTSLTARNLYLKRQSLLYRLEKIETLTGMSLSDRNDLFLLEVFTRIYANY